MPLNVVLGANNLEQKRQECIYELIYTEQDFTKDMHYVQDVIFEKKKSDTESLNQVFFNSFG